MKARRNFYFIPTVSRELYLTDRDGETAYVQHTLVKYLDDGSFGDQTLPEGFERYQREPVPFPNDTRLDPLTMEVYVCVGLNAIAYSPVRAAERLGAPPGRR